MAWALCGLLGAAALWLLARLLMIRRAMDGIAKSLAERVTSDTNTLIDIDLRDRRLCALANALNAQLRLLRAERRRFRQGDTELKEAVANISHDLRTPLTALCGYVDLLLKEDIPDAAGRYARLIENRAGALCRLTEELFRYSVLASVQDEARELISLGGALEESLAAAYGALTARGIEPVVSIPEKRVERTLSRSALSRILENILSNAVKYSDGDLSVTLTEDGAIAFENAASGLSSIAVGRLFDRFYTVDSGERATGLGLSIAKLLTERMGGEIDATYRDGRLAITLKFPGDEPARQS